MISHFIVSSVAGVMLTLCEMAIAPQQATGASVGIKEGSKPCPDCNARVLKAWITLQG